MDIAEFLTARVDEDEAVAREAGPSRVQDGFHELGVLDDDYRHATVVISSERLLAEVAAKRAIVDLHGRAHECVGYYSAGDINTSAWCVAAVDCDALRVLARVYADHPDYDPAWALESAAR